MRLRQRSLKQVTIKKKVPGKDPDGTTYTDYEDTGTQIKANIQPAGGKLMAEMYGQRLAYMLTMLYDGSVDIKEDDGVCVHVPSSERPDYKVVGIQPWAIKMYTLEKV